MNEGFWYEVAFVPDTTTPKFSLKHLGRPERLKLTLSILIRIGSQLGITGRFSITHYKPHKIKVLNAMLCQPISYASPSAFRPETQGMY